MGNWRVDLFKDGLALDIKYMFEELITSGLRVMDTIEIVLDEYQELLEDFDEGAIVILALGNLIAEHGYISKDLKNELNRLSNNEEYWLYLKNEDEKLYNNRLSLLNNLVVKFNVE